MAAIFRFSKTRVYRFMLSFNYFTSEKMFGNFIAAEMTLYSSGLKKSSPGIVIYNINIPEPHVLETLENSRPFLY
jgi:hypothetical protein